MIPSNLMFACNSMHLTNTEALMLLCLLGGFLVGAVATVVNGVTIFAQAVTKIPLRLGLHLTWWSYYALPWLIHWSHLYQPLAGFAHHLFTPVAVTPHFGQPDTVVYPWTMNVAMIYLCTVPVVTITQFVYLVRSGLRHHSTQSPAFADPAIRTSEILPTSQRWDRNRIIAWSLLVLLVATILGRALFPVVIRHKDHLNQINQVGLALKLYAGDHQGMLPQHLEDMMPTYFTKRELLDHVEYVVPGANLVELPPKSVIARRAFPDEHLVSEVHADMSAEEHKF